MSHIAPAVKLRADGPHQPPGPHAALTRLAADVRPGPQPHNRGVTPAWYVAVCDRLDALRAECAAEVEAAVAGPHRIHVPTMVLIARRSGVARAITDAAGSRLGILAGGIDLAALAGSCDA